MPYRTLLLALLLALAPVSAFAQDIHVINESHAIIVGIVVTVGHEPDWSKSAVANVPAKTESDFTTESFADDEYYAFGISLLTPSGDLAQVVYVMQWPAGTVGVPTITINDPPKPANDI